MRGNQKMIRHYLLHDDEVQYRYELQENEDGSRKYTWVRSCWVGSTEAEIRGQRYRVELDL